MSHPSLPFAYLGSHPVSLPVSRLKSTHLFYNGDMMPARGPQLEVISPVTEQPIGYTLTATTEDIDAAVSAARHAFDRTEWPMLHPTERAAHLVSIYDNYQEHAASMASLITAENGSPVSFTAQTNHPMQILIDTYSLARVDTLFGRIMKGTQVDVTREPVGVVAIIVPWNMPQKTIMMKLAPALLAGCTVIIKPAPETPFDAMYLPSILGDVLPPGVVNILPVDRDTRTLEHLVTHPGIDKIAFTGSTATGQRIATLCAPHMRRLTLELGGKSAAVIVDDADLDATVTSLRSMSLGMSGQICSNLTRVLVPERLEDEFVARMEHMFRDLRCGDPSHPDTEIGPLVSQRQQARVRKFILEGIENNEGQLVVGGDGRPDRPGWFVHPTLFTKVDPFSRIFQEEIFGPVVCVTAYRDLAEAVKLANDTRYGLAAAVYTEDAALGAGVARRLRAGTVHINGVDTPTCAPLGGFKQSGIGRELGPEGLAHYQELKVVAQQTPALRRESMPSELSEFPF